MRSCVFAVASLNASSLPETAPNELLKYWWWPGMAFASTYYLVVMGLVLFVGRQPGMAAMQAMTGGAVVTAIMALYGYYLGHRRHVEDEQAPQLSSGMLRCPFVMGILGKSASASGSMEALAGDMALSKTGSKG